ncbi:hypothetical protein PVAG01_03194 [Phlyctema vagabunda]|uniref:Uncharacterized protein n=1 Tax=Phlyctema vagabunda TaxID=108571 RepID=A0ABR4PST0_9HELO
MPPKKSKGKAAKTPSTSKSASKTVQIPATEPPPPFTLAPKNLEPFFDQLSPSHVYITHIDTKPVDFKRNIFLVPVFMNIAIVAGIVWRIYTIGPWYLKLFNSIMGNYNEMTIDTLNIPVAASSYEILRRAAVFMVDLVIYVFIWPWPREFVFGRRNGGFNNPLAWRFGAGFRSQEIVVRRSRKWDRIIQDPFNNESEGTKELFDNLRAAVEPVWMNEKTGYVMLNKWWDLDWSMMVEATRLVDKQTMSIDDFKTTVLLHTDVFGWVMIESSAARGTVKEEEGRRKIIAFKDALTTMGKENLFFRWIELVQYESSQPGGFGPERQASTMVKAKALFEEQDVDFDAFWAKIGGMQGMPGMDQM